MQIPIWKKILGSVWFLFGAFLFLYGWRDIYLFLMPAKFTQTNIVDFFQSLSLLTAVSLLGIILGLILFKYAKKLWPILIFSVDCYFIVIGIFFAVKTGIILWGVAQSESIKEFLLYDNGEVMILFIVLALFYFFINILMSFRAWREWYNFNFV